MILVLAIESATPRGSVALARPGRLLGEVRLPEGRQTSETFLAAAASLLSGAGAGKVSHVAVSAGPGSFTGLRVGMAAAKGFAFGWSIPVVCVPTLQALAARFRVEKTLVCPVLDARKKEVYAGFYRWEGGRCVPAAPDAAVEPERLASLLPLGPVLFCGDGIGAYGTLFREALGDRALFPPPGEEHPRAASVALLGASLAAEGAGEPAHAVVPRYLRRAEAEIRRDLEGPPASS